MILYLDTSSIVKLYIEEHFSRSVEQWIGDAESSFTCNITYPETLSAFSRRRRDKDVTEAAFQRAVHDFKDDWLTLGILPVHEKKAGDLVLKYGLRGFDAVHLAAALTLHKKSGSLPYAFSSFDQRLNEAAEKEGLPVIYPE